MHEIRLALAVPEVNEILDALGQKPYASVYRLVAKIQEQAAGQLEAPETAGPQVVEAEEPAPGGQAPSAPFADSGRS